MALVPHRRHLEWWAEVVCDDGNDAGCIFMRGEPAVQEAQGELTELIN